MPVSSHGAEQVWGSYKQDIGGALKYAFKTNNFPKKIKAIFKGAEIEAFTIDLNSDGEKDYIVHQVGGYKTCYFTHNGEMRSCNNLGYFQGGGFHYRFFAQLDSDPMLELFMLSGFEDGNNFILFKFDAKTWKSKGLFPVHTLLIPDGKDKTGIFWGYPWNIKGLKTTKKNKQVFMEATFKYKRNPYDAESFNPDEEYTPAIYFYGSPTQGGKTGKIIDDRTPFTLKMLITEFEKRKGRKKK